MACMSGDPPALAWRVDSGGDRPKAESSAELLKEPHMQMSRGRNLWVIEGIVK